MTEEKELVSVSNEAITLDPSHLKDAKEWEDFINLWMIAKEIDQRNQWFKGDIANGVVTVYGEGSLIKFSEDVRESIRTVENYRRVARAFPEEKRYLNLSWTHYFIASYTDSYKKKESEFDGENRFRWIEKAHDEGWSTPRLTEETRKAKALKGKDDIIFDYYDEYIKKVRNVLLHIDKAKLTNEEKKALISHLKAVQEEFETFLRVKT